MGTRRHHPRPGPRAGDLGTNIQGRAEGIEFSFQLGRAGTVDGCLDIEHEVEGRHSVVSGLFGRTGLLYREVFGVGKEGAYRQQGSSRYTKARKRLPREEESEIVASQ